MKDPCFVIRSGDLDAVRSDLIGFLIADDGTFYLDSLPPCSFGTGCFVLIRREGDRITVCQDYCGSFGLFLYEDGEGGFMLSDSFQALADELGSRLTLDRDYMESLLYASEGPLDMNGTLAREIRRLDPDIWVEIDTVGGDVTLHRRPLTFYARKTETAEDLAALDRWYLKWVRFYRGLKEKGLPLYADLSGGLDTRIILSMLRNAGLDLSTAVCMTSHTKVNIPKDAEDMRISRIIADTLGFRLNSGTVRSVPAGRLDPRDSYRLSRQFTMGQTMYCRVHSFMEHETVFFAKGLGSTVKGSVFKGGGLIGSMAQAMEEYDDAARGVTERRSDLGVAEKEAFLARWHARLEQQAERLTAGYIGDEKHTATYYYQRTRIGGRDAKKILDSCLRNRLIISPFIDPEITAFDYDPRGEDRLFLPTLILDRYDPKLLEFEIEHRAFSPASLERAREIDRRFPVSLPSFPPLSGKNIETAADICPYEETTEFLRGLLSGPDFARLLDPVIGRGVREAILAEKPVEKHEKGPFRPYALMAVYEFLQSLEGKGADGP